MLPSDTYASGPIKVAHISEYAVAVDETVLWLESRQNRNGSWGRASALEKVIATCHAVMVFLACGYPVTYGPVQRGIAWLTRDAEATSHRDIYWRLGPLLKLDQYHSYIDRDLQRVEEMIAHHANPDENQILEIFLLKALRLAGRDKNDPIVQHYLELVVAQWDPELGWRNRADRTSQALGVISEFDFVNKEEVVAKSKRLIELRASRTGPHVSWDSHPTSTAYVIMNLVDAEMFRHDPDLQLLMDKAVDGLIHLRHSAGYWPAEKHTGGAGGDIPNPDFYTAVIVRGIVAFHCAQDPSFPLQLMWLRQSRLARKVSQRTTLLWLTFAAAAAELVILAAAFDSTISALTTTWFPQILAFGGGALALLAAIETIISLTERAINWRRERHG